MLVHERLLLQHAVADSMLGRVFGLKDMLSSWGFCAAFLGAGALLAATGPRTLFLIAGGGALVVWFASAAALRRVWRERREALVAAPAARAL